MTKYKYITIILATESANYSTKEHMLKKLTELYEEGYEFVNQSGIYVTVKKQII